MRTEDFDYSLPPEMIAQEPAHPRDSSRLMVVETSEKRITHRSFTDIKDCLRAGDCLVLNETRVIPARLIGRKSDTGGRAEVMLLKQTASGDWEALVKPSKRIPEGTKVEFGGSDMTVTVGRRLEEGKRLVSVSALGSFEDALRVVGQTPLPPYIKKKLADPEGYQTVYSKGGESVAAPTAGLHFTEKLLGELKSGGIDIVKVSLDVGAGTFRPVMAEDVRDHQMDAERFSISEEAADAVNEAKAARRRVVAVGTTSVRVLESAAGHDGKVASGHGETELFIYPGFRFKVVDCLLTNFHLPRSSLIMLVCAFAGTGLIMDAYREAIRQGYRFYSFGDAMFITERGSKEERK